MTGVTSTWFALLDCERPDPAGVILQLPAPRLNFAAGAGPSSPLLRSDLIDLVTITGLRMPAPAVTPLRAPSRPAWRRAAPAPACPRPSMSTLPEPSIGSLSSTQTSDGIIRSEACLLLAKAWNSPRVALLCCVSRMSRSPLRRSGTATTADGSFGHSSPASASTAASEIISPPILANRLARPLMVTKPCSSMVTMSPVSCQPSAGGSSTPGFSTLR